MFANAENQFVLLDTYVASSTVVSIEIECYECINNQVDPNVAQIFFMQH